MAKKSMVERENKRKSLNLKYSDLRYNLRENAKKVSSFEEKLELSAKLQKLPRNSSISRSRNRCIFTGRSRGYYRFFGLSRHVLRDMAHYGLLPGVTKSSW